ncbi:peroxisome biogenesis protein 5-like isoform X1 [Gossypium hirsutum]|uniref:Peroxisome biogenesis protein 5-like isoform X1 n=1 Tax=Gossypium hirsutum TaxID=3635 RepID=A0ABM3BU43_GOSHI|nr:peroxisome biogenesis protein 5-like isoform X1 [Gossypium hirsutum]
MINFPLPVVAICLHIQEQSQLTSVDQMRGGNIGSLAAIQQTRMLAHTLSQNSDPKFRVKPASENWATEYQQQYNGGASWADEFAHDEASRDLVEGYKEGQELFRKGLLSEAVLSLEAEVIKSLENAEGWRLLGITHAENDDGQQAIAAMMRAQEADPTNLEVLLALGVSHTNELEQTAALKYLYGWLRHHPKYGTLAPPELANSLYYADVARLFIEVAQMSPEDADVHIVLAVLYNLSGEYDKAIASFKTALKLKPNDYSLWNKPCATQANSVQSADAILAYQQALDLKPNYVRAWANIGVSYANQVLLSQCHRFRALVLLGRFLDMGPWAVDLALSVGIFPYVLKLLQTTTPELRQILVFIWTKILALPSERAINQSIVPKALYCGKIVFVRGRNP